MLVTGLTKEDITCLDIFEGSVRIRQPFAVSMTDEALQGYVRQRIEVYPFNEFRDISANALSGDTLSPRPLPNPLVDPISAETYVYRDEADLEAQLWSYGDFVKYNAWKWYGTAANDNDDITEVDRMRENGHQDTA